MNSGMSGIYVSGLLILFFGLLNLFGLSQSFFWHQLVFACVGLLIFFLIRKIGRNFFVINSKFFYWLFIGLLILVFFFGEEVRGAKRWLDFGYFNFQPSEFFKIFFIILLSRLLIKKSVSSDNHFKFLSVLFYFLIPLVLIFKQPDLGTTLVFTAIFVGLVLVSDLPKKYFLNLLIFIVFTLPLSWFILKPYQQQRLLSFFNPHLNTQGTAYNMIQSIITVGSGRFFGKGLGLGTQTKLLFLPENFTDFSYASLVEQFGFFGGATVMILFLLLGYFIFRKMKLYSSQTSKEGRQNYFYIFGVFTFLIIQIVINIGMNLGLVPITGITLPLISYGGSSLVSLMLALALLP